MKRHCSINTLHSPCFLFFSDKKIQTSLPNLFTKKEEEKKRYPLKKGHLFAYAFVVALEARKNCIAFGASCCSAAQATGAQYHLCGPRWWVAMLTLNLYATSVHIPPALCNTMEQSYLLRTQENGAYYILFTQKIKCPAAVGEMGNVCVCVCVCVCERVRWCFA